MPSKHLIVDSDDEGSYEYPTALFDSVRDTEWTSPSKRQRVVHNAKRSGSHRRIPRREPESPSTQAGLEDLGELLRADDNNDKEMEVQNDFKDSIDQPPATNRTPSISDLALAAFVDAVNSYSVGFYHLEQNLFVVQGYDVLRNLALVSPESYLQLFYLILYPRIIGTILNSFQLMVQSILRVPAQRGRSWNAFIEYSLVNMRSNH